MTIAPIVRTVTVKAAPARAFELFTAQIGRWWPAGKTVGKTHAAIVIEPRNGGRWYERDAEDVEIQWGRVIEWAPPSRLLLAWQLDSAWTYDPDFVTEVELSFAPATGGGTLITLEHRNLERFGDAAEKIAGQLGGGWPSRMADFADFANADATTKV
jgi:uncharacterized protein YndB with AHSA1/START domain